MQSNSVNSFNTNRIRLTSEDEKYITQTLRDRYGIREAMEPYKKDSK